MTATTELQACLLSLENLLEHAKKLAIEYDEKIRRAGYASSVSVSSLKYAISFPETRSFDILCRDTLTRVLPDHPELIAKWYVHDNVGLDSPEDLVDDLVRKRAILQHALSLVRASHDAADSEFSTTPKTSILFLAADPTDASRLRLGVEFREIQEKLKLAKLRGRFKLELPQLSVRPADFSQALLDVQPQIVHFSGHGTSEGALCFETERGQSHLVQPEALAAFFEQFAGQVKCVVLNACYSEIQARAIAKYIDYVIGMNQAIGDNAAIAFAIGFYQALGAGRSIEEAYKFGCVQIKLQDIPEHLTPVLIKKSI